MSVAPPTHATVEELIRHRLSVALGGWRGAVETALPPIAFLLVWSAWHDVRSAALVSIGVALVLGAVRLLQRSSLQHVLGAIFATAIAAFFALRSGRAEDVFLPGLLTNATFLVVGVVSILSRWPLVGFIVGAGDPGAAEDPFGWRRDAGIVRVCNRLTWVLVAGYAIRLAVMVPLYLAAKVGWLTVAKLALGWPLWAASLALMGGLLLTGHTPLERVPFEERTDHQATPDQA